MNVSLAIPDVKEVYTVIPAKAGIQKIRWKV